MNLKLRAARVGGILMVAAATAATLQGCGGAAAQTALPTLDPGAPAALAALDNAQKGQAAIAAWRTGFKTGDFSALVAMLDDNVEYRLGIPPYNTIRRGKADAVQAFQSFQSLTIRVDQTPIAPPMFSGNSTTFEFQAKGTVGGNAVEANLLVVFDIVNGKIVRMREYSPPA